MKKLLIVLFLISFNSFAEVKDPSYDEFEGLDLIEILIRDGKLSLAEAEIAKIKSLDSRSYFLKGRLKISQEKWSEGLTALQSAEKSVTDHGLKLSIVSYQAVVLAQLEKWDSCAKKFSEVPRGMMLSESQAVTRAQCEKKSNDYDAAWRTLLASQERWGSFTVETEKVLFLLELKLKAEATSSLFSWFASHPAMPSQYQNMAEIFLSQGESQAALEVIELGRMAYPLDVDINLAFAQFYFQKNNFLVSAEGFGSAALSDPKYFYHAAENYRQLQMFERSQYFNQFIFDPKGKLKQTMALYIDQAQYSKIASMENIIMRSELHKDDELRYALAYSMALNSDVESPLKYLATIQKPELLEKSTLLRKALLDCKDKKDVCRL